MQKNIIIFTPSRFHNEIWIPALWAQAKTYYERNGRDVAKWNWVPCYADAHGTDISKIKESICKNPPDVFGISLYVWNNSIAHEIAAWVKQQWPNCIIISGGPHQYFKHDINWFKQHPWLDASLPGDAFGEQFIASLLDSYSHLDWAQIPNAYYPQGNSRSVVASKKSYERTDFDFDWGAFAEQQEEIQKFVDYKNKHNPGSFLLSIIETTRGCPYGCTYCDWGGGINTKIISKDIKCVQQDIDALCSFGLSFLYFADANLGMLKERDVDIVNYLVSARLNSKKRFTVGYGGFAKTANRLDYIKQILKIDVEHKLSNLGEIKISVQSLDEQVLKNIDRKNIPIDQQLAVAAELTNNKIPVYAELILGLPGMTLDKFYHELDVLGSYNISAQWYEWILLPEAPAYSYNYREKYGMQTLTKTHGWYAHGESNCNHELVVATNSYTTDDYLEMLVASGLFKLIIQGGYYKETVSWLISQGVSHGQICCGIVNEFKKTVHYTELHQQWIEDVLVTPSKPGYVNIQDHQVFCGFYIPAVAFLYHNSFTVNVGQWLVDSYNCPTSLIELDQSMCIHNDNSGKTRGWIVQHNYRKPFFKNLNAFDQYITSLMQFKDSGNACRGSKKFLGLINF